MCRSSQRFVFVGARQVDRPPVAAPADVAVLPKPGGAPAPLAMQTSRLRLRTDQVEAIYEGRPRQNPASWQSRDSRAPAGPGYLAASPAMGRPPWGSL